MSFVRWQSVVGLLCSALLGGADAWGSLTINFRFPDGSLQKNIQGMQPNETIDFEVWASIKGQPGNPAPEGLRFCAYSAISFKYIINGDGFWIAQGITARTVESPFNMSGSFGGVLQDSDMDGTGDMGVGSTTTNGGNVRVSNTPGVLADAGFGQPIPDGWEFRVQRVTFTVAFTDLGLNRVTRFDPVLVQSLDSAWWFEDGAIVQLGGTPGASYARGTSVTFLSVPEPSCSAFGALGVMLIARARRRPLRAKSN